MKNNLKI